MFSHDFLVSQPDQHSIFDLKTHKRLNTGKNVAIGNHVWIGTRVTILNGVTVGDGAVIAAGSVVTKDIPSGVVAVGNPCRILREVGEHDRQYYFKDREINSCDF